MNDYTKVFLNGIWLGTTKNPVEMYNLLKIKKMKNDIDKTVTMNLDYFTKNLNIYCDGGRMYRPLLKVTDNKLNISLSMLNDIKKDINKSGNDKLTWNSLLVKYP